MGWVDTHNADEDRSTYKDLDIVVLFDKDNSKPFDFFNSTEICDEPKVLRPSPMFGIRGCNGVSWKAQTCATVNKSKRE